MIYIIIVLAILLLLEGLYATLLSSRIHKLELLNMNYSSKIIELEIPKIVDEKKLDELAKNYSINEWGYTEKVTMNHFKAGYKKAKEE